MTRATYGDHWRGELSRRLPSIRELLDWNILEDFDAEANDASEMDHEFQIALDLFYGHRADLGGKFAERAIKVFEKMDGTKSLLSRPDDGQLWLLHRGILFRDRAYATHLLGGDADDGWYQQALKDLEAGYESVKSGRGNDFDESNRLSVARLALIHGDGVLARRLVEARPRFKWHDDEAELVEGEARLRFDDRINSTALRARLDQYFNRVRDPEFKPQYSMEPWLVRLEIGLIRDRYFVSDTDEVDWDRAIKAIAA